MTVDDTIHCGRCSKDIPAGEYVEHRAKHRAGFQAPPPSEVKAEAAPLGPEFHEDASRDDYVPAYARKPAIVLNGHLTALRPRRDTRPKSLDEAIEAEKKARANRRESRSNLIR